MVRKAFLDTNILIDFLANREPFGEAAKRLFRYVATDQLMLYTSVVSMVTTHYILRAKYKLKEAEIREAFIRLGRFVTVLSSRDDNYQYGLKSDFQDFEDSVQYFTALDISDLDAIITRNKSDFTLSDIPVLTAEEFIAHFFEES